MKDFLQAMKILKKLLKKMILKNMITKEFKII